MGKLSAALNAIFSTSGDAGLTSSMKVPYFKSKTIDGNTAFYPDGMASMSALASVLGAATIITNQNDLNNIVSAGVYAWSGSGTAPLNNFRPQGSLLLVWRAGAQTFQLQWPNNIEGSGLGFRVMWNNEWKPWYKVEVTLGQ